RTATTRRRPTPSSGRSTPWTRATRAPAPSRASAGTARTGSTSRSSSRATARAAPRRSGAPSSTATSTPSPSTARGPSPPGARLELLGGTHPAVYVSQGKHASYPEPGEWRDYQRLAPLVEYDDVFHGNGVRVETWKGRGRGHREVPPPAPGVARLSGPLGPRR